MKPGQQNADQGAMAPPTVPPASDTPQIPRVVRVYGMIIMVFNAIVMCLVGFDALLTLLGVVQSRSPQFVTVFGDAFTIVISFVFFRLGRGLRAGERQAVYGLCILGGLALLAGIGFLGSREAIVGIFLLLAVAIIYAPPIVSAFRHWTTFK